MLAGISYADILVGSGTMAERGKVVLVHCRGQTSGGTACLDTYAQGRPLRVHLGKREVMVGLERGIEGMRVGGRRLLEIAPHLAGSWVQADQQLVVEVELVEVRETNQLRPEDYPPGKRLFVFRPGEAARKLPRWQFGMEENGRAGVSVTLPHDGLTWRHARTKHYELQFTALEARALMESVETIAREGAGECLAHEELWADSGEKANSITRDRRTNTLCLTIFIQEADRFVCHFSMKEDSPPLLASHFYRVICGAIDSHLNPPAKQQSASLAAGFRWSD